MRAWPRDPEDEHWEDLGEDPTVLTSNEENEKPLTALVHIALHEFVEQHATPKGMEPVR